MKKQMLLLTAALWALPLLQAHEGHVHEAALEAAPHGGLLRDAAPFKAEAVINADVVRIYIYDQMLQPVKLDKKTIEGKLSLPKKKPYRVEFALKDGFYESTIKDINKVHRFDLHVNLHVGEKQVVADFGIDNIQ